MNSIPRIYNLVNKNGMCFSFSILEFRKLWDDDQRIMGFWEWSAK